MADHEFEQFARAAAAHGLVTTEHWDHDHAMRVLRENRRRNAHTHNGQAYDEWGRWIAADFTVETGVPAEQIARVLLLTAGKIAALGFVNRDQGGSELHLDDVCNVLGYTADVLDREAGGG